MIPRVLRNFSAFVNGLGYLGRVTECELPDLKVKTEDHRGAGMDAPVEIDMGMEVLTAKLTFAEYIPDVMKQFGNLGSETRIQIRGALQRDKEIAVPCVVEFNGGFKTATMGTWKTGDIAMFEAEASIRYYKLTIGTDVIYEIDVDNGIRNIGGVDVLASIRAAIGA
jgi:hypothetical protein